MNTSFPRIITLLRKEKGISQKVAAQGLQVSQALLSHYEKGIRECGLEFLSRVADFYGVSCDYILGRTPDRTGAFLTVEDIPDPEAAGKENAFHKSILPTLNKKLIANSLNIIYDKLQKCDSKSLTNEVSVFFMLAVYRVLRLLHASNPKNPMASFAIPSVLAIGSAAAAMQIAQCNIEAVLNNIDVGELEGLKNVEVFTLTPEQLSTDYPLFANSMLNLVQTVETRMGYKAQKK